MYVKCEKLPRDSINSARRVSVCRRVRLLNGVWLASAIPIRPFTQEGECFDKAENLIFRGCCPWRSAGCGKLDAEQLFEAGVSPPTRSHWREKSCGLNSVRRKLSLNASSSPIKYNVLCSRVSRDCCRL